MLNSMTTFTAKQREELARELGLAGPYLYQLLTGRREMEPVAAVRLEQKSGGRLRRWHLRAKTWNLVWPELIGVEGAPPIPEAMADQLEAEKAKTDEVRHAA